jgi:AcrR family transcriptional regulator
MTQVSEHTERDSRKHILNAAERLFRQIGYKKTTVGDIAKELRMSPANVYRFFESKKAIRHGVVQGLMGEIELEAQRIVSERGPALERFRELLTTVSRMNIERFAGDAKLHEIVEIAMQEDWEVCLAHSQRVTEAVGDVIAQAVALGEFETSNVPLAARCTFTALIRFFHPRMVAQAGTKPGPSIDQMIDLIITGLSSRR